MLFVCSILDLCALIRNILNRFMKFLLLTFFMLISFLGMEGQTVCTAPGQNPATAFPVCGTSTFTQNSVPICGGRQVPAPTCNTYPLADVNPYWYKFTCFQAGTLGFRISPAANSEDYDWQLFDITGRNPNDVYTDVSLVKACNWSGEGGATGASSAGSALFVCEGLGKPLFSKMPDLQVGHEYLLLVSHFTQTQSGYSLSFNGGTAVITDSTPPKIKGAEASCGGNLIRMKLNKKMKCSSISPNGSDFYITPGLPTITGATAIGCTNGFDTDSVEIQLASTLSAGSYTLNIQQGQDGNTILDYCNNAVPITDKAGFTVTPVVPTPMDSLAPVLCKPGSVKVVFPKPMLCSSLASNGSDFSITGPSPVVITGAVAGCTGSSSVFKEVVLNFSNNLVQGGTYTVTLRNGTDGNTLLNECVQPTPAGSFLTFSIKDTVNARFSYLISYGCEKDTVRFSHPGQNGVDSWKWSLDENKTSTLQNPQVLYQVFNAKNINLVVSNGFCTDSCSQTLVLDNFLEAGFESYEDNCPNETVQFTSTAQGKILTHSWSFGDGGTSDQASPQHIFTNPLRTTVYLVRYSVTDSFGCTHSTQKTIRIYSSCFLAVPTAFTPNGDGLNDQLYPLNAVKAEELDFRVYNRWGQLMYQTSNWKKGWDGNYKGRQQGPGAYVWFLSFVDRDSKERRQMKGTAVLIR
jgi:gliding motility-associated-like protein